MSYQVFALKWRPQRFADVVGQEHVTRPLQNAIREGRVPHAFLLTGARGVGKTTTARILAKALVCEHGPAPEPCNECRFCREVTAGSAIDVVEMDAASNTGIDDVRELRESLMYAPAAARFKIYIVDEVHMLSKEAFNAFLKTLEEPPPHVKFIFATTDLHKVPITIQSRCQRYDFRLLDRAEIVEQLRRIVEAEGIAMSPAALGAVAGAGEGSMRDAESLLEQVVAYCGRTVRDEEVAAALGLPEEKTLLAFCADLLGRRGAACLATLDAVAALGMDARVFAREVLGMLRNLAVLRAAPEATDLVPVTPETLAELQRLAAAASPGTCSRSSRSSCASRPRCATRPSRGCCSSWRCCARCASRRCRRSRRCSGASRSWSGASRRGCRRRRRAATAGQARRAGCPPPRPAGVSGRPAGECVRGAASRAPRGASGAHATPAAGRRRARRAAPSRSAGAARSARGAAAAPRRRRDGRSVRPAHRAGAAREGHARRLSRARAAAQGRRRRARDRLRARRTASFSTPPARRRTSRSCGRWRASCSAGAPRCAS